MSYCSGLTGRTGGSHRGGLMSSPPRWLPPVRGKGCLATIHHACLTLHPGSQRGQSVAWTDIVGVGLLKQG
ncbi:hypothetical protein DNI29_06645 [Hymenobacter sediminis]|nr:hypothetical protein [Hymenobacter sediminis]RPD48301.1 hypothetical protein DNI29_06645 [Hymenobacter sediminis]